MQDERFAFAKNLADFAISAERREEYEKSRAAEQEAEEEANLRSEEAEDEEREAAETENNEDSEGSEAEQGDEAEDEDVAKDEEEAEDAGEQQQPPAKKAKVVKPMTKKKLEKYQREADKKGVVYMSRIPPGLRPAKLRHILSQYGAVLRIYFVPEDVEVHKRRKRAGGNRKLRWKEGWIEFADKSLAKQVALSLNNTPMEGLGKRKNSHFNSDIWNLKYLPKFKWHHLTEKQAQDKAQRKKRLAAEISQARRANNEYLLQVQKAKVQRIIQQKAKKKMERQHENGENADDNQQQQTTEEEPQYGEAKLSALRNRFRQWKVYRKDGDEEFNATNNNANNNKRKNLQKNTNDNNNNQSQTPNKKQKNANKNENKKKQRKKQNKNSDASNKQTFLDDEVIPESAGDLDDDVLGQIFGN